MDAKEAKKFKQALLERRRMLVDHLIRRSEMARNELTQNASGNLSTMPFHMADVASDAYEEEFALGMIESQEDELQKIDEALDKLREGVYGICEECEGEIGTARLKVMPYARLCIKCKSMEEKRKRR